MVSNINTSGISVDSATGRVSLSGFASRIDTKAIINATMTAKRIPAVKLEAKITANQTRISAMGELKTLAQTLTTTMDKLRNSNSFLSDNVFKSKTASGTTAAAVGAPPSHVASDITSLVSVSVGATAQTGTHTLNIQQIATAHQLRSDSFTSKTDALTGLGITAGTFEINGIEVEIDADDTLIDLRGKLNAANAGVTATIVSASDTSHFLVLTSTQTGVANQISFDLGTLTSDDMGFTTNVPADGTIKNQLVEAQDAEFTVNGITGITRSTNDVDDVIEGLTLSLLRAETDTDITLKIEPDLVKVKSAVLDFVEAYNAIRDFYTGQRTAADRNDDGRIGEAEFGPLATDNVLRQMVDKLGQLAGGEVAGNITGYRSLSQIGLTVGADFKLTLDNATFDSKLITNVDGMRKLFGFDFASTDARLNYLGRTDNTQNGTYYLNIAGTDGDGNITDANLRNAALVGNGGANDGSLVVVGKQATAQAGSNANGLLLFFNGAASLGAINDIQVSISRGVVDSFYDYFSELTRSNGTLDTQIAGLTTDNFNYQSSIETIDARLETARAALERRYVAMETALARLESLRNTISSYFDFQNSKN